MERSRICLPMATPTRGLASPLVENTPYGRLAVVKWDEGGTSIQDIVELDQRASCFVHVLPAVAATWH